VPVDFVAFAFRGRRHCQWSCARIVWPSLGQISQPSKPDRIKHYART
jgi:hypothetical protein